MNEVSGVKILVQAMATTEFWTGMAFILVFGGGCFACYRAAAKAEHDGNRRKATILGVASIAILIAGFVIESHFDIFPDDDDDDEINGNGRISLFSPCGAVPEFGEGAVNVREHGATSMSSFFPLYRREFVE